MPSKASGSRTRSPATLSKRSTHSASVAPPAARRRVLSATAAANQVGYVSASQFSREFKRFFGVSPANDAAQGRLRSDATG